MFALIPLRSPRGLQVILFFFVLFTLSVLSLLTYRVDKVKEFLDPVNRSGLACHERIQIANLPEADWYVDYSPGKSPEALAAGAKILSATALLDGTYKSDPYLHDAVKHSRIIHQSWKTHDASGYPLHALWHSQEHWIALHPGWVYVLWDNADNRELVRRRYSELSEVYDGFQHEIARADFVRNLYMHAFGGVYADLDVIPLRNMTDVIEPFHDTSRVSTAHAYVGEMLNGGWQSIPNAWMASSQPGHPFWKATYERTVAGVTSGRNPHHIEKLTGPEPLYWSLQEWQEKYQVRGGMKKAQEDSEVVVLRWPRIYPYSWAETSKAVHCLCSAKFPETFDPRRCISLNQGAWTISFWGTSWK